MQCDHSCVTSGQASIENNSEGITRGNHHTASSIECNREGVPGTGGYRHTDSAQRVTSDQQWNVHEVNNMRIVQVSEDGRVSAVLPERSDDLDPPALEEFVEFSEDGRVSVVLPERSDELDPRAHI